ncbi:potassium channel family protein [Streptomyces fractus]|uniref:potassium channel family protein n=1 Tax=Streptomyces fractus TaxID=641806 RepID=UPI003CEBBC58
MTPQHNAGGEQRLERWQQLTDWPLLAASVLFFVAYAVPILDTGLSTDGRRAWRTANLALWTPFAADYAIRLLLARRRKAFVRREWLDALLLVIPVLRPLRVLRILTAAQRFHHRFQRGFHRQVLTYTAGTVVLLGLTAALTVLAAERGAPGASIQTFGDAIWWTFTTLTTVGYGDTYPVTTTGRVVAALLMTGGVALLGVLTASFSSWFTSRFGVGDARDREMRHLLAETKDELARVREELAQLRTEHGHKE